MSLNAFNIALALGWLLVLIGGCLVHVGAGLALGGLLLIGLTFVVARIGGIYAPTLEDKDAD